MCISNNINTFKENLNVRNEAWHWSVLSMCEVHLKLFNFSTFLVWSIPKVEIVLLYFNLNALNILKMTQKWLKIYWFLVCCKYIKYTEIKYFVFNFHQGVFQCKRITMPVFFVFLFKCFYWGVLTRIVWRFPQYEAHGDTLFMGLWKLQILTYWPNTCFFLNQYFSHW